MAECMMYMFYQTEHHSEHSEMWDLFETEHSNQSRTGEASKTVEIAGEVQSDGAKGKSKGSSKGGKQQTGSTSVGAGSPAKGADEPDKKLGKALKSAYTLKATIQSTQSLASTLVSKIESGGDWSCFNNAANVGALKDALVAMEASFSEFDKTLLVMSQKDIRGKFGAEHLHVQVERFMSLKEPVAIVDTICKRLQRGHKAMTSIA
jgi:hypothetical protein